MQGLAKIEYPGPKTGRGHTVLGYKARKPSTHGPYNSVRVRTARVQATESGAAAVEVWLGGKQGKRNGPNFPAGSQLEPLAAKLSPASGHVL